MAFTKTVSKSAPISTREWNQVKRFPIIKDIRMQKVRAGPPIIIVVRRREDASGPNTSLPPQ